MTLEEIFETDCDGVGTGGAYYEELPHIYVSLPEADLAVFGIPLDEGWRPSKVKGLWYRINPERPQQGTRRNIHISQKKDIPVKDRQASWNVNGTRHDQKSFNIDFGSRKDVRAVAIQALGLDPNKIILENYTRGRYVVLIETVDPGNTGAHLRLRIKEDDFSDHQQR